MKYIFLAILVSLLGLSNVPVFAASKATPVKNSITPKATTAPKNIPVVKNITPVKKVTIRKVTVPVVRKIVPVIPRTTTRTTPSYDKPVEDYNSSHSNIENPLLTRHYNLPSGIY